MARLNRYSYVTLAIAAAFALIASLTMLSPAAGASTRVVPPTVDPTGSEDVTSELVEFFNDVPDGSTVRFMPGSTYRIEGSIILTNRHDLTIDGSGATFIVTTDGSEATEGRDHSWWGRNWPRKRGQFILKGGSGYTISNLTIDGPNAKAGPTNDAFVSALEAQHGIEFYGTTDSTVENCHIHHTYGDFISVSGDSRNITIRDCNLHNSGRQGVTVDRAQHVTITNNIIERTGRSAIDLEPARFDWTVEHVTVANNTIGRANGVFIAAYGNGPVNHITIDSNTLKGEEMKVLVRSGDGPKRHHWTVTNNTTNRREGSPLAPLRFSGVDHITLSGNYQPIVSTQSRKAVSISGATTVTIEENDFPILHRGEPTGETAIITVNGTELTQPIYLPEGSSPDDSDDGSSPDEPDQCAPLDGDGANPGE